MPATRSEYEISAAVLEDPRWALVERVASSQHLRSSARLRDFLFYIADCAIRGAPDEATEQQIGIRVFNRPPGYNSSEDSIVRTHARLLRQKLAVYFVEEGLHEETIVEVPKGHYIPAFRPRADHLAPHVVLETAAPMQQTLPVAAASSTAAKATRGRTYWKALILALSVILVAVLVWRPWARPQLFQSPVDKFWSPFFSDDPPLLIYSNALFVGDSTNGLRYAHVQGQNQDDNHYVDTYTGIGELASVYTLTRLFDAHRSNFILKRSLLMTWDEAKVKNLVFLGSIAENPSLRVLESTTDFTMIATPGTAGFVNHHPKAGEPQIYSRPEQPLTKDYAILALLPGVQPGKRMLIFSGLTTFGTQAAVDFVCHPDTASELLKQITTSNGEIHPFEAVLETSIGGGVPLQTRLVTIRVH